MDPERLRSEEVILEARGVTKLFTRSSGASLPGRRQVVRSLDEVTLGLPRGSATALVGESGSGKSTLARIFAALHSPTSGEVFLDGARVQVKSIRDFRRYCRRVQLILQDPFASLNPHHSVGYHVERPLRIHGLVRRRAPAVEVNEAIDNLLREVGLVADERFRAKLPHELSGGQRQRVAIARALAARPQVLIADEPVSMLDVSIRLGVLEMLRERQRAHGLTILYVTHDLPTARYFGDTIAVMYAGQIVEQGPADVVVGTPRHPYTQLLLDATPEPGREPGSSIGDRGEPPSLINVPSGCPFHPRCPHTAEICRTTRPEVTSAGPKHWARCWLNVSGERGGLGGRRAGAAPPTRSPELAAVPTTKKESS
jgi:peptide/nickel transport system ATP-binding protein